MITAATQPVAAIVSLLGEFCERRDIITASKIRAAIRDLCDTDIEIALPLWEVTRRVERELIDLGEDDE